ncbi:IclR family transcriptional regulator [Caenimonas aquaedulcis]|uniref:IclR family transcriptional regulator n=1 Tax=Caenimonas aquaedulcis TaxID=2793270 RepID=A0A931MJM0_9BURK|nr:IclR family transcriptional regulator [Caenimonas aquaedulcis]MBG9390440.1 IclR family transcriptional regulator [Caenimonas aquaedulcis]
MKNTEHVSPQAADAPGRTVAVKPRINSVARAINIMLEIAGSDQGLSAKEISERLEIERQTVYHLLHTLSALRVVTRDEHRKYRVGLNVGMLSAAFRRQFSAPIYLHPIVSALAEATGETCYAVGWCEEEIVTLAVVHGVNAVASAEVPHGQYTDAHARASGKLLLALAPLSRSYEYLQRRYPLSPRTGKTLTDRAQLEAEFRCIRADRFSMDDEEFEEGVCCMAIPLEGGHSPYAIALSAPAERMRAQKDDYLQLARRIARGDISPPTKSRSNA